MSVRSKSLLKGRSTERAVRPALVTVIACLELAAAAWDGGCFLKLNQVFPVSVGDLLSLNMMLPALMCITAIYAGVGLFQMRQGAWAVWMGRHAWLTSFYLLSIPGLLLRSMYVPGASLFLAWRFTIIIFSLLAGVYLYAVRQRFDNGVTRLAR